jgi:ABC-type nitrate/sulfonate/bicarbonate transport system substrate-binding protein
MRAARGAARLGAALLVALMVGCQPGGMGPAAPAGGRFVAIEQGYFAEEGLEVTLERVGSAAVAVEALVDHRYVEYALARLGRYVPAEGQPPGR